MSLLGLAADSSAFGKATVRVPVGCVPWAVSNNQAFVDFEHSRFLCNKRQWLLGSGKAPVFMFIQSAESLQTQLHGDPATVIQ